MDNTKEQLLVLALDAGDIDFIQRRRESLPCLHGFLDGSLMYRPASPKALSGSVWPTFYTSDNPGVHGMYQHLVWNPDRMGLRIIDSQWCDVRPFWTELEQRGRNTIVLDIPYSFPTDLKRGIEITDWGTHGQTHPLAANRPDVKAFLTEFGPSPIGRETPVHKTPRQLDVIRDRLVEGVGRKTELMIALMSRFDWDVFIAGMGELHRGGHLFFSDEDESPTFWRTRLLAVYEAADRAFARILSELEQESTTILAVSVHGMRRDNAQCHLVRPVMKRINARFLRDEGIREAKPSTRSFVAGLRRHVPAPVQHFLGDLAPDPVRRWVVRKEITGGLRWDHTPGFALRTDIRTELRLNLRGREPKGMLEPHSPAYFRYVDLLRETFLGLRNQETGAYLVDEVVDTKKLFHGSRVELLPDFVVTWKQAPAARRVYSEPIGDLEALPTNARGGDHTDLGFAALRPSVGLHDRLNAAQLPPLGETEGFADFILRISDLLDA